MHGISTARQITLRNITVQDCNQSGIQATTANGIRIERFVVRRCNRGLWKFQPITAGIKITKTDQSLVMHGRIYDVPNGAGLWWDTYCPRLTAVGVYVDGATAVPGGAQMDVGIHPGCLPYVQSEVVGILDHASDDVRRSLRVVGDLPRRQIPGGP